MKLEAQWEDGIFLNGEFIGINGYGITRKAWDALRKSDKSWETDGANSTAARPFRKCWDYSS